MSYSVGFIPAMVEGASFCPGEFLIRPQGGAAQCHPHCPPGWKTYNDGTDEVCAEPSGVPTLMQGCPGQHEIVDEIKGYHYCAATCPSGWRQSTEDGVKLCSGPPTAGGLAPGPGAVATTPAPTRAPSEAGVGIADLPWWAYAIGATAMLGAAAYYARG